MNPLPDFILYRPDSLDEALELLAKLETPKPIAGGTDLLPLIREVNDKPRNLVDLGRIEGLVGVREDGSFVTIGAMTTHSRLLRSEIIARKAPALHEAVACLGSVQIRNRGTIGGNLCNASPAADTAPPLLSHDAEVTVTSIKGTRVMPLGELFAGPKISSLEPHELLTEIRFPTPPADSGSAFHRIGRRKGFTLSVVNAAAYVERNGDTCSRARVALGSVAPTPIGILEVGEAIEGRKLTLPLMGEAGTICEELVKPVDDVRGSAEYRREMAGVLVKRALRDAWTRAGGIL